MMEIFLCTVTTFKDGVKSEHVHLVKSTRRLGAEKIAEKHYQFKVDNGTIDSFVVHINETLI